MIVLDVAQTSLLHRSALWLFFIDVFVRRTCALMLAVIVFEMSVANGLWIYEVLLRWYF